MAAKGGSGGSLDGAAKKEKAPTLKEVLKRMPTAGIVLDGEEPDYDERKVAVFDAVSNAFGERSLEWCEAALALVTARLNETIAELKQATASMQAAVREDQVGLVLDGEATSSNVEAVEARLKRLEYSGRVLGRAEAYLIVAARGKRGALLEEELKQRRARVMELREKARQAQTELDLEVSAAQDCDNERISFGVVGKDDVQRVLNIEAGPRISLKIVPTSSRADMVSIDG